MSHLELRNVSKSYGATPVLSNINLSIEEGEFVALIGFSGSGKTTLMSILAGLIEPDAGEVRMRGQPAGSAGPDRGVVFQSYSLMPWLTVFENVALAVDAVFASENQTTTAGAYGEVRAHGRPLARHRPASRGALGRHASARRGGACAGHQSGIPAAR